YLRDNLSLSLDDVVQRGLDCAFIAGVDNSLTEYYISAQIEGSTQKLARITAYGLFRRYRKLAGVGEPTSPRMDVAYEDVWDAQGREFYERRQRVLTGENLPEFGKLAGNPAYERRCREVTEQTGLGPGIVPELQRLVLLTCADTLWRDQLAGMSRL